MLELSSDQLFHNSFDQKCIFNSLFLSIELTFEFRRGTKIQMHLSELYFSTWTRGMRFLFFPSMSNYKEICTVPTKFGVTFTKFKSEKTGLTVVLADVEGYIMCCALRAIAKKRTVFF